MAHGRHLEGGSFGHVRVGILLATLLWLGCSPAPDGVQVPLPGGPPGIGFDDLRYSSGLHRVLVPGGRSGNLYLIDPTSKEVSMVAGFGASTGFDGGHDAGPTSVDEGRGFLFVTDRTTRQLSVVDPQALRVLSSVPLGASPDYVRFVAETDELWVTEPSASRIEIFALGSGSPPQPAAIATIAVDNGPESLVIDPVRHRAYTHRWQRETVAIDLASRAIVASFPNGCAASRGIDLDAQRGFLFAGCSEGTATVLDVDHGGALLGALARGAGFDVIAYRPETQRLFLAGSACACLIVAQVQASGALSFQRRFDAPSSTHCVTADDAGGAWVCDPDEGALLKVEIGP